MGSAIKMCGQCVQLQTGDTLLEVLEEARTQVLNQSYQFLLTKYRDRLSQLIKQRKKSKEIMGDVLVQVIPCSKNPQQAIQWEMKLVLKIDTIRSSDKQDPLAYRGCIIYSNSYYYGEIMDEEAHGKGTLYTRKNDAHQITGLWSYGELKRGVIYRRKEGQNGRPIKQEIAQLQIIRGQKQAIVTVKDRFVYKGSINLRNAFSYAGLLTGQGIVKYQNGDQYHGRLVQGKYETQPGKQATFIYASGIFRSFKGSYRRGLPQDMGVYELQVEGIILKLHMSFNEGIPCETALACLDNGSQYPIHIANQQLRVQSNYRLN